MGMKGAAECGMSTAGSPCVMSAGSEEKEGTREEEQSPIVAAECRNGEPWEVVKPWRPWRSEHWCPARFRPLWLEEPTGDALAQVGGHNVEDAGSFCHLD
jgi:hypothetical protein